MNFPRYALVLFWGLCAFSLVRFVISIPSTLAGYGVIAGLAAFYGLLIYPFLPEELNDRMKNQEYLDNLLKTRPLVRTFSVVYFVAAATLVGYALFFDRRLVELVEHRFGIVFVLLGAPLLIVFALVQWDLFKALERVDV